MTNDIDTPVLSRPLKIEEIRDGTSGETAATEAELAAIARLLELVALKRLALSYRIDRAGSGRTPLNPVAVAKQRAALTTLASEVFSADSFRFPPDLLRRASITYFDIANSQELGSAVPTPDLAIDQQVLTLQRLALNQLMTDTVAQRLLNNEAKAANPKDALRLNELYGTLHMAIWSELKTGREITLFRRNLQREHATRLATALLRPSATMPTDARAQLRADATLLRTELVAAQGRSGYSPEARAHLAESLAMIDEALKAPIVRQGV